MTDSWAAYTQSPSGEDAHAEDAVSISLVIPLYRVEKYLPDLLKSLDAQVGDNYVCEIIFVDDGSPDASAAMASDWLAASRFEGQLLAGPNRGVSVARNRGIDAARHEWITFPDSDDFLDARYLSTVAEFLRTHRGQRSHVVAANLKRYSEEMQAVRDTHALRFKFRGKAKTVDLALSPHYIHLVVHSAFFRLAEIRRLGIRFLEGQRISEDALFVSRFLTSYERPILGVVPRAVYFYRQRLAADSAVDVSYTEAEGYIERFERGYLPLLRELEARGAITEWIANLLIYEYRWLLVRELRNRTKAHHLTEQQRVRFLSLAGEVMTFFRDEWILGYRVTSMPLDARYLLIALKGSALPDSAVYIRALKPKRNLLQLTYHFVGSQPAEDFRVRAQRVTPVAAKTRAVPYFNQQLLFERIIWLPANSWLAASIAGRDREIRFGSPQPPAYAVTERQIFRRFGASVQLDATRKSEAVDKRVVSRIRSRMSELGKLARAEMKTILERRQVARVRREASSRRARRKYAEAWVLMDRFHQAQDNAEYLYKYLRQHRPDINVWFVLSRASSDWKRLKSVGFRVVAFGSRQHHALMLNAVHLVSSHIDIEQMEPIDPRFYPNGRPWDVTFLQHGVIKDDLSSWLNPKTIDRFITSTPQEYESIVRDGSAYKFSQLEVRLTGLPRHDFLLERRHAPSETGPWTILVAPTWREGLMKPKVPFSANRELVDGFADTDFNREWSRFLKLASDDSRFLVKFLPHPILESGLKTEHIPEGVELLSYRDLSFQDHLTGVDAFVTDYSSLAFEAAFASLPVVYHQFDREEFFGGGHTAAPGYFDYYRNGFGPVASDAETAYAMLCRLLTEDSTRAVFTERADATFPFRDGKCCERVVEAIEELDRPVPAV